MDEQVIRLLFIAAIAIFALIKQLRKGRETKAPPPPPPRPDEGRAAGEPEEERIDLSFLQGAFESLGIELPEQERETAAEHDHDHDDFDELEPTPPPRSIPEPEPHPGRDLELLAAAAYEKDLAVPRPPTSFFADLDDYWDHETQTQRSGKAELLRDAVILDAVLAPYRRH